MNQFAEHPLANEDLIAFAAAARDFPSRSGGRANPSTIFRWATVGAKTPVGRVRLQRIRIGSTWFTSRQAIARFLAAIQPADAQQTSDSPAPRTPGQRQRAAGRAGDQLTALGI